MNEGSWPISRVLSWTVIHLGQHSHTGSSSLPGFSAGRTNEPLFGLAPGGVYRAASCYQSRGALLPHPFTLTCARKRAIGGLLSVALVVSFLPRRYLAPCPMEPGLSSPSSVSLKRTAMKQRLSGQLRRGV